MNIRKARKEDIPAMMDIFAYARNFMRNTGNPDQWGDNYPSDELLESVAGGFPPDDNHGDWDC